MPDEKQTMSIGYTYVDEHQDLTAADIARAVNLGRIGFSVTSDSLADFDREPVQVFDHEDYLASYAGYYWSTFVVGPGSCEEPERPRSQWPSPSPLTGFRTPAFPPSVRLVAENAERIAAMVAGVKALNLHAMCPMLEIDQRNAAIVDALVKFGEVTLTAAPDGLLVNGKASR